MAKRKIAEPTKRAIELASTARGRALRKKIEESKRKRKPITLLEKTAERLYRRRKQLENLGKK